jgi:hypothetical protein
LRVAALVALAAAAACARKDDDKAATSSDGPPAGDDDYTVVKPVPINLLDPTFYAKARAGILPALATKGAVGDGRASGDAGAAGTDKTFAVALAVLEAPGRAAGQMGGLLADVEGIHKKLFGPGGTFADARLEIGVPKGQTEGSKLFAVSGAGLGDVRFAEFFLRAEGAYPYAVDLYVPTDASAASFVRSMRVEFAPDDGAAGTAGAVHGHLEYRSATAAGVQRGDIVYASATSSLTVLFGLETPTDAVPEKTLIAYDFDANASTMRGGYVWRKSVAPPADVIVPRYDLPATGDAELFVMRAAAARPTESAQSIAYLTAADAPGQELGVAAAQPAAAYGYPRFANAYAATLARARGVNTACATTGSKIRNAYGTKAIPPEVAALPDDVCRPDAGDAAGDVAMLAALDVTCDAGIAVLLPVTTPSGDATVDLCDPLTEAKILTSPQILAVNAAGTARDLVTVANASAEAKALADGLGALTFPDPASLRTPTWPAPRVRPAADFAGALPPP